MWTQQDISGSAGQGVTWHRGHLQQKMIQNLNVIQGKAWFSPKNKTRKVNIDQVQSKKKEGMYLD